MLPWKLRKYQILPVSQNLSLVYFSPAKFRLVSSNLSLTIIWQESLFSETAKTVFSHLKIQTSFTHILSNFHELSSQEKKWENVYSTVLLAPGRAINMK